MSLTPTRWWWPALALFANTGLVEATSDNKNLALILGCSIGGIVFVLLIIILFILVCKRPVEKPRHSSNSLNSRSAWTTGPGAVQVPPGVWTANPSMYALRQQQTMIRPSPKLTHHPGHHANGYVNRKPQPLTEFGRQPWYVRTIRYAHNKLKHFPYATRTASPTSPREAPAPQRPKDVKPAQRSRSHRPTRDKTVKEMTMKLEDDERFPQQQQKQQQNCGIRTSLDTKGDRPEGTAAARIYRSEPCLEGSQNPHVAKIYSDYGSQQLPCGERREQTNKDVARAFRSCADVSRSKERGKENNEEDNVAVSPIYAIPQDAITQSDWALERYKTGVTRSTSHVTPSNLNAGRNPYGRGVFMRSSDAAQHAHKRPQSSGSRHSGSQTPIPSQILMFQHLQQQQEQTRSQSSTDRGSQSSEVVLRPVSRSQSDVSDMRYFAPENDPDAIYAQPMKLKRHSVESKGSPPGTAKQPVALLDGMSPRDSTSSKSLAPLSPINEGPNQMTVHAVIENHDDNPAEHPDARTDFSDHPNEEPPPTSPISTSPTPPKSPDRLSAILPHDGRASRRRSVDELTTMSEKHHQGEVMDAFRFLEDFDDAALSAKE